MLRAFVRTTPPVSPHPGPVDPTGAAGTDGSDSCTTLRTGLAVSQLSVPTLWKAYAAIGGRLPHRRTADALAGRPPSTPSTTTCSPASSTRSPLCGAPGASSGTPPTSTTTRTTPELTPRAHGQLAPSWALSRGDPPR